MTALTHDFIPLTRQRKPIDLNHVVEHSRKDFHDFAIFIPIKRGFGSKWVTNKASEIDRSEQAGAIGRQWLLTAWIGGSNILAPPVVIHFIDPVDQHEAWLREIVGRGHDVIPHAARRKGLINLAADKTVITRHIAFRYRPFAPQKLRGIANIWLIGVVLFLSQREGEIPIRVLLDGLDEFIGDQKRQIELPQPTVLTLGLDEFENILVKFLHFLLLLLPGLDLVKHVEFCHESLILHTREASLMLHWGTILLIYVLNGIFDDVSTVFLVTLRELIPFDI